MNELTRDILEMIETCKKRGTKKIDPETGAEYIGVEYKIPGHKETFETRIPEPTFHQPPVDFEKQWGMTGIAGHYRLPAGLSARDLETYTVLLAHRDDLTPDQRADKTLVLWNVLVDLNPELAALKFMHTRFRRDVDVMLSDAIIGVASAFNVSDPQYFNDLRPGEPFIEMRKRPDYKELLDVFNKHAPPARKIDDLDWVASPSTMKLIAEQIVAKHATKPAARKPGL